MMNPEVTGPARLKGTSERCRASRFVWSARRDSLEPGFQKQAAKVATYERIATAAICEWSGGLR
jgi:hypothetical protein